MRKFKSAGSLNTSKYQLPRKSVTGFSLKRTNSVVSIFREKLQTVKSENNNKEKYDFIFDDQELLKESEYASLCDRHRKVIEARELSGVSKTKPVTGGETFDKLKRKLCRIVSFRNGHYQVSIHVKFFSTV